jgi:hypothetical protein
VSDKISDLQLGQDRMTVDISVHILAARDYVSKIRPLMLGNIGYLFTGLDEKDPVENFILLSLGGPLGKGSYDILHPERSAIWQGWRSLKKKWRNSFGHNDWIWNGLL